MRKCDRTERRIADRSKINLEHGLVREWTRVVHSQGHDQVVRMLGVDDRFSESGLARLEQQWIAPVPDRQRVKARHHLKHEASLAYDVFRRAHEPVRRIKLIVATRSRLLRIDYICLAHEHEVPCAALRG